MQDYGKQDFLKTLSWCLHFLPLKKVHEIIEKYLKVKPYRHNISRTNLKSTDISSIKKIVNLVEMFWCSAKFWG